MYFVKSRFTRSGFHAARQNMPWPPLASQVLRLQCCEGENLWKVASPQQYLHGGHRFLRIVGNPGSLCLYRLTDDSKDRINERTISCGLKLTTFSGRAKDRCNAEISSERLPATQENHHASPTSSVCHNGRLKRNGRRSLGKDRAGDSGARGAFGSWPLMCAPGVGSAVEGLTHWIQLR
jgi:hypothetical protein